MKAIVSLMGLLALAVGGENVNYGFLNYLLYLAAIGSVVGYVWEKMHKSYAGLVSFALLYIGLPLIYFLMFMNFLTTFSFSLPLQQMESFLKSNPIPSYILFIFGGLSLFNLLGNLKNPFARKNLRMVKILLAIGIFLGILSLTLITLIKWSLR